MEYTLIEGINDRERDSDELIRILKDLNCHVNLIPLNPIKEFGQKIININIEKFK